MTSQHALCRLGVGGAGSGRWRSAVGTTVPVRGRGQRRRRRDAGRHHRRPRRRRRRRQAHPGGVVGGAVGQLRPPGRAQGREPAAHRLVQDPRGDEQAGLARPARQGRGHRGQRRQPRPGAGVRGEVLRRPVRHLRPRRRGDLQDRGVPRPRVDGDRAGQLGRGVDRRRQAARRPGGQGVLPSLRRPRRRRRAGNARSRARRGPRRPQLRHRADRRRRARQRRGDRRQVADARTFGSLACRLRSAVRTPAGRSTRVP